MCCSSAVPLAGRSKLVAHESRREESVALVDNLGLDGMRLETNVDVVVSCIVKHGLDLHALVVEGRPGSTSDCGRRTSVPSVEARFSVGDSPLKALSHLLS